MTRQKAQRGSLLSSIVMVMLATVATALLAFIGFQALPDSVIPATFGGEDRTNRHVNVTEAPSSEGQKPTAVPSTNPPFPSATANPNATDRPTQGPRATRTGSTTTGSVRETVAPKPSATTTPPKPKPSATTTSPKPSPSATQTTQTASPAPTCGTGRKPRCPRSAEPAASSSTTTRNASYGGVTPSYSDSSYDAPTKSTIDAKKKAPKKTSRKSGARKKARGRR